MSDAKEKISKVEYARKNWQNWQGTEVERCQCSRCLLYHPCEVRYEDE